jgi:tyrosyl-tRNA synthetase
VVFTMPLLVGLDGARVMGQSLGNYVGIDEPPEEMFGKLMRIPDGLIGMYLRLCTILPDDEIGRTEAGISDGSMRPDQAKRQMAREVVALYHGAEAAAAAEERFDRVFREHRIPEDVPEVEVPPSVAALQKVWLPRLIVELGLAASNSEARRQVEQGGVRIDGQPVADPQLEVAVADLPGKVIQVGRRKFVRVAQRNRA